MKLRNILFAIAAVFLAVSCVGVLVHEIRIAEESENIFKFGMRLDSDAQTATVKFNASDAWSIQIDEMTKAPGWLSVEPMSGMPGDVTLTISAQQNSETTERYAIVAVNCSEARESFMVTQAAAQAVPPDGQVTAVTMDKTILTLFKGATTTLTVVIFPASAAGNPVTWGSSDTDVVTVTDGVATAVGAGTATITAKVGDKTASCTVTVVVPAESIVLNQTQLTLPKGETFTLTATIEPEDATDTMVLWQSSDTSVATVARGTVTAVSEGEAVITAKVGDIIAQCAVTVEKEIVAVSSVTLDKYEINLTKGSSETLTASVSPEDATDKTVVWSSSDEDVVTVSDGVVTATGGGIATVTAKAGTKVATCKVTVTVPVTSITLDKATITLKEGDTATLTATVGPDDADDKTVTWLSSASNIATVEDGKVTALSEGTATIMAFAGNLKAVCEVIVTAVELTAVDLGLSVKWAECNVGAASQLEFGDYFAWGETSPKASYSWSNYAHGSNSSNLTHYCEKDGKTVLDASDDAASAEYGRSWRMPTHEELQELVDKCTWTWQSTGVPGYTVTGPNGNSIFLPAAAHSAGTDGLGNTVFGFYWAADINSAEGGKYRPYYLHFTAEESSFQVYDNGYRPQGSTIRAVCVQ